MPEWGWPKPCVLAAPGLKVHQVQKHKGLEHLAQVARAHQPRDGPMRGAACAVGNGPRLGDCRISNSGDHAALRAVFNDDGTDVGLS